MTYPKRSRIDRSEKRIEEAAKRKDCKEMLARLEKEMERIGRNLEHAKKEQNYQNIVMYLILIDELEYIEVGKRLSAQKYL